MSKSSVSHTTVPRQSSEKLAAIYARVSTEDQGKGFSLSSQIAACQALASKSGYTVPDSHIFTDELSGATLARPGLQQVRALITRRAIAVLVVYDPDRLSRNLGHQLVLAEEAEKSDVILLI